MSDDEQWGKPVFGIGTVGTANEGELVLFSLRSRDGSDHKFFCYAGELPGIMHGLSTAGRVAEEKRAQQPGGNANGEIGMPFMVVGDPSIANIEHGSGGKLAVPLVGMTPYRQGVPAGRRDAKGDRQRTWSRSPNRGERARSRKSRPSIAP